MSIEQITKLRDLGLTLDQIIAIGEILGLETKTIVKLPPPNPGEITEKGG